MMSSPKSGKIELPAEEKHPHPHDVDVDVDVKALTRLATVYDLPMASAASTATLLMGGGLLPRP